MNYEVTVSDCNTYIICRVTQPITIELAREFTSAVRQTGLQHGIKRFLFDVREAPNTESIIDNYKFATRDISEIELDRAARSAVLIEPDDRSHDFVVTASMNAGHNVRLFEDRDAAIAWLK